MKKIAVLLLVVFAVLPAFTQAKSNHDFKSSVNTVTNGMFKEDVDKVLDVTGFNAIEGNIIGTQITNVNDPIGTKTDIDFVWGKKFDWFYLGAGYNGSIINQTGTNNTETTQNNSYTGPGGELSGSTTDTDITNDVRSWGFRNNAQVLFGFNNVGFKLSFDSAVPNNARRGTLDSSFNPQANKTTVRTGDAITGTYTDIVYDTKGFTNGDGLFFKPHLDFGVNLGMGMGLWVTAHAGLDIRNRDSFNGKTEINYVGVTPSPNFATSVTEKNYRHNTRLDVIAGAEVGATFGIVEPSFAYDFGVRLNTGKTFAEDKKTAFSYYSHRKQIDNTAESTTESSNYSGAAAARAQTWQNKIAPAVKVSPDFGDKVKFALKVSVPVTITSGDYIDGAGGGTGKSGLDRLSVITTKIGTDNSKMTVASYQNESYHTLKTDIAPVVEMGMRLYTPSEKMSFNFGFEVTPFKYTHKTETLTVADHVNVMTTVVNGVETVTEGSPAATKTESKKSTDNWTGAGIDALGAVKVGFTWYVNTKLTFDMDLSVLGASETLLANPFYYGVIGLTATYKY